MGRVSLADGPDLFLQLVQQPRRTADAPKGSDEIDGVPSREWSKGHACHVGLAADLVHGAPGRRGVRQFLVPAGHHEQHPPGRNTPRHEGEQAQAHLVRPVHVFEYQDQEPHG